MDESDTLMKFPCEFALKAMGLATGDFDALILEIVSRHVENVGEGAVHCRPSSSGKYLAVTVTFQATSKVQLDAIYQELTDHERVLMSL
ncbi:MAG: DUF493 domain-containing protein [Gammaproteobacteria bacterium]|nr:DUF493 domain-containing protein [Gammaproteobacteria bacterium]